MSSLCASEIIDLMQPNNEPLIAEALGVLRNAATSTRLGQFMKQFSHLCPQSSLNDYMPIFVLGEGSFGQVLQVERRLDKKMFALKSVERRTRSEDLLMERNISLCISSPFIVGLVESFRTKEKVHLVMPLMNCSLFEILYQLQQRPEIIKLYCREILAGIEALHLKRIIHFDLKPENVLLDQNWHVKIGDFGMSTQLIPGKKNCSISGCTKGYCSPEYYNIERCGLAHDLFSVGCIFYQIHHKRNSLLFPGNEKSIKAALKDRSALIQYVKNRFQTTIPSKDVQDFLKVHLVFDESKRCNGRQHQYLLGYHLPPEQLLLMPVNPFEVNQSKRPSSSQMESFRRDCVEIDHEIPDYALGPFDFKDSSTSLNLSLKDFSRSQNILRAHFKHLQTQNTKTEARVKELEDINRSVIENTENTAAKISHLESKLKKQDSQLSNLKTILKSNDEKLANRDNEIKDLDSKLKERDSQLSNLKTILKSTEEKLANTDKEFKDLDSLYQVKCQQLAKLEAEILQRQQQETAALQSVSIPSEKVAADTRHSDGPSTSVTKSSKAQSSRLPITIIGKRTSSTISETRPAEKKLKLPIPTTSTTNQPNHIKKFKCNTCNKSYTRKEKLELHVAAHHGSNKSYQCTVCNRHFGNIELLRDHTKSHNPGAYVCASCGMSFRYRSSRKAHKEKCVA